MSSFAFSVEASNQFLPLISSIRGRWNICRLTTRNLHSLDSTRNFRSSIYPPVSCCVKVGSDSVPAMSGKSKSVWIWTENKQVMTAAVERGWNTFIFSSECHELAKDWSAMALINPMFIDDKELRSTEGKRVATFFKVSSPKDLDQLLLMDTLLENVIIDLLDWQVIPAENIVAAFQGRSTKVLAIANTPSEAQIFFEALEHGLGGVVLKADDVTAVLTLKDYFDKRNEVHDRLSLIKATVSEVHMAGMGDRVCVDLCCLMRPGQGLLGPVHSYVAVPDGKTSYLSELKTGMEVIVVDQDGLQQIAIIGRVKIETRPMILVEAKQASSFDQSVYSILLQNAETVALVSPSQGNNERSTAIPVTSLKVGDQVLLRVQGGARHTGLEIEEFIVEK